MFGFKKKKQLSEREHKELRRQKDHDFWMNELQYLWFKDLQESLTIRGRDIECCWVDNHGNKQWVNDKSGETTCNEVYTASCDFMIRTHSGKEFSLKFEDWLKVRFEDPNYKCVK